MKNARTLFGSKKNSNRLTKDQWIGKHKGRFYRIRQKFVGSRLCRRYIPLGYTGIRVVLPGDKKVDIEVFDGKICLCSYNGHIDPVREMSRVRNTVTLKIA